jgi:putative peptidoglycan lipid II flippase
MAGLIRSNLVVASGTAVSRITGLVRIVIFGMVIGQTALADAFDGANNAPNAIYELFIGGVLSASLVPLFARLVDNENTNNQKSNDIDAIASTALYVLVSITVVAVLAAPAIFHLFSLSPSSAVDADAYREAGTALTRIFLVQIFFYGISAITSALLNARRQFFAAAWSPALANIVAIAFLLYIPSVGAESPPQLGEVVSNSSLLWTLGLSTTAGVAIMALTQLLAVRKSGIRISLKPQFRHPAVARLVRLSTWTLGYVVANQIALVVIKNLASPGSGWVDAYAKAFIIFQLPHGLLAVSLATTFVPELSRLIHANNEPTFARRMSDGIRYTAMLTIPAAVGLFLLARPTVAVLLQHGNFDATATTNTARALSGLALGVAGFSVYLFVLRGFYARNDTRTPFFINLIENALNIIFALLLVDRFDVLGLGIAFSLAYLVSAAIALAVLHRSTPSLQLAPLLVSILRIVGAAVLMAIVVRFASGIIGSNVGAGALLRVLLSSLLGLLVYVISLLAFGAPDIRHFVLSKMTKSSR